MRLLQVREHDFLEISFLTPLSLSLLSNWNALAHKYKYNCTHTHTLDLYSCPAIGSWVHPGEYASSGRYHTTHDQLLNPEQQQTPPPTPYNSYIYGFIYITCKYIKYHTIID